MTDILHAGPQGVLRGKALQTGSGAVVPVAGTTASIFRETFAGSAVNAARWDVASTGSGMAASVSGGALSVNMGTTDGDTYTLTSRESFGLPVRVMVGVSMSQRIVGNAVNIELVSVDPATGVADGLNSAGWKLDQATATQGVYYVSEDGLPTLTSGAVTIPTTAAAMVLEIEPSMDEVWFAGRALDSTSARANSYVRHQQIPDPNALYRLRLRFTNFSAPASATTATFNLVSVVEHAEVAAEITSGRGANSSGAGVGVYVAGGNSGSGSLVVQGPGSNVNTVGAFPVATALTAMPSHTANRAVSVAATLNGATIEKPYSIPENDRSYSAAAPIAVTTDTAVLAAAGASLRNYVTAVQFQNTNGTATEVQVKDGSTVLWRGYAPANMAVAEKLVFPTPLRGTANTAVNVALGTAGAAVYLNVQAYVAT